MSVKEVTLSRRQAREIIAVAQHAANTAHGALQEAPYRVAKRGLDAVDGLADEIAARLGFGPIMSSCESCEELIFGDESYAHSDDGVRICEECCGRYDRPAAPLPSDAENGGK